MKQITSTVYGAEISTAKEFGINYIPSANSTLNEALSIMPNVPLNDGEYPYTKYWCAGIGGHRIGASSNGLPKISAIKHSPSDAALYNHMPLVLRLESNDLTPDERKQYCLRIRVEIGGKFYFAYYGKRLDLSKTKTEKLKVTVVDGVMTSLPFVPTNDNIKPIPMTILPNQVMPTLADGNYLMVRATTVIPLTEKDIIEYRNACTIILGDEEQSVISEVGLFSGVERTIQAPGPGGGIITFKEVGVATLVQAVSTYENLNFSDAAFNMVVNAVTTKALETGN